MDPTGSPAQAFRRFRDLVHDEELAEQWCAFSADRQLGRAREFLADEGSRVVTAEGEPVAVIPERCSPVSD